MLPSLDSKLLQVLVRLPLTLAPTGRAVKLTHARGYLYLATPTGVAVFNTTGYGLRRPPKMVSAHSLSSIAAAFTADDAMVSCQHRLERLQSVGKAGTILSSACKCDWHMVKHAFRDAAA